MLKKKKVKKVKKVKKAKKVKFLKKDKSNLKLSDKKSTIPGPDEKPEIKKIKKQPTEKKIYNLKDFVVLDYCQYGTLYRKRTRIAHSANLHWEPKSLCNPKTCHACPDGKTHLKCAQRGPNKKLAGAARKFDVCTVDELHALPQGMTEEILKICESHNWEVI